MPPILPLCSEGCGDRIKKQGTKTCGKSACRSKRSRRLARGRKKQSEAGQNSRYEPEVRDVALAAQKGAKDIAAEIMRDELRPVVREALTSEVLSSLQSMVALTPRAIELLSQDMESDDPVVRERARDVVLRYTLGHKSIAPPPPEEAKQPLQVVLNVPGSGAPLEAANAAKPVLDAEVEEIRECMDCHQHKPDSEFVSGSDKCQACFDIIANQVKERFGK